MTHPTIKENQLREMDYKEAWRHDEAAETLWNNPRDELVILAPHGGDVEYGTDDCAARLHKQLREHDPVTWMRHGFGENAFDSFHLSSNKIREDTYEKLSEISGRRFRFAVSFHMHNEDYVAVGGQIEDGVRREVARRLRDRLPDSKEVRWRHGEMKYEGSKDSNVVNWLTESGGDGLQLELTPKTAYVYRKRVARGVADVYRELLAEE